MWAIPRDDGPRGRWPGSHDGVLYQRLQRAQEEALRKMSRKRVVDVAVQPTTILAASVAQALDEAVNDSRRLRLAIASKGPGLDVDEAKKRVSELWRSLLKDCRRARDLTLSDLTPRAMDRDLTTSSEDRANDDRIVASASELDEAVNDDRNAASAERHLAHCKAKKKSRKSSCSSSTSSSRAQDISAHRHHDNQKQGHSEEGNNQRRGHATANKKSRKSSCSSSSSSSSSASVHKDRWALSTAQTRFLEEKLSTRPPTRKTDTIKFSGGDKKIMQKEIMKLVRNRRIVSRRMKWLLEELGPPMDIPRKREAQWEMLWPLLKRLRGRDLQEQKVSLWIEQRERIEQERTEPGWGC